MSAPAWFTNSDGIPVKPDGPSHLVEATPEALVDALVDRCREILTGFECQDALGHTSPVKIWAFRPPSVKATDGDPAELTTPSVIVDLVSGSGSTWEQEKTTASMVITVGDRNEEQQGQRDAQQIARMILVSCTSHPVFDRAMRFTGEWEWQTGSIYDGIAQCGLWLTFKLGILKERIGTI